MKPKRADSIKKNSPVDCFLGGWCAVGYCEQSKTRSGRQAGRIAMQYASRLSHQIGILEGVSRFSFIKPKSKRKAYSFHKGP